MQHSWGCQDLSVLLNAYKMLLGIQLLTGQSQRLTNTLCCQVMEDQGLLQMRVLIETLIVIMIDYSMNLPLNFMYNAGLYAAIF